MLLSVVFDSYQHVQPIPLDLRFCASKTSLPSCSSTFHVSFGCYTIPVPCVVHELLNTRQGCVQVPQQPCRVDKGRPVHRRFSGTAATAKKGWIKPPPEIIRSDILNTSLHKQKQRPSPPTFKFKILEEGNTSNEPICNWNARQREWLVDCLNTVFDNCVVSFSFCFSSSLRFHVMFPGDSLVAYYCMQQIVLGHESASQDELRRVYYCQVALRTFSLYHLMLQISYCFSCTGLPFPHAHVLVGLFPASLVTCWPLHMKCFEKEQLCLCADSGTQRRHQHHNTDDTSQAVCAVDVSKAGSGRQRLHAPRAGAAAVAS